MACALPDLDLAGRSMTRASDYNLQPVELAAIAGDTDLYQFTITTLQSDASLPEKLATIRQRMKDLGYATNK